MQCCGNVDGQAQTLDLDFGVELRFPVQRRTPAASEQKNADKPKAGTKLDSSA